MTINTQSYPEGGAHLFPKKIIDTIEYKPVTLQRGVTLGTDFDIWAKKALLLVRGYTSLSGGSVQSYDTIGIEQYRQDVVKIHHLNRYGTIVKSYILYNVFPIEYKPASDFSADGDDLMSMEKLVLAYESFEVVANKPSSNQLDPSDLLKRLIRRA